MAWQTSRNNQLTGLTLTLRAIQFLILMKETLDTAGWTIIGYGDGVDDSDFNLAGVADTFPAFPATTDMADFAWFAAASASGMHCVFQVDGATGEVHLYWSGSDGYTDDGVDHVTRVGDSTPPTDEIGFDGASTVFGGADVCKVSVAYTDDAESFIVFCRRNAKDVARGFVLKLLDFKVGDTDPYVSTWYAVDGADNWTAAKLQTPTANEVLGWHPTNAQKEYAFSKVTFDGVDIMSVMIPDPVTGDDQLLDALCGCQIAAAYSFRGVVPGIVQIPATRGSGDKFASNKWMAIGDWAIDGWNSTDSLEE